MDCDTEQGKCDRTVMRSRGSDVFGSSDNLWDNDEEFMSCEEGEDELFQKISAQTRLIEQTVDKNGDISDLGESRNGVRTSFGSGTASFQNKDLSRLAGGESRSIDRSSTGRHGSLYTGNDKTRLNHSSVRSAFDSSRDAEADKDASPRLWNASGEATQQTPSQAGRLSEGLLYKNRDNVAFLTSRLDYEKSLFCALDRTASSCKEGAGFNLGGNEEEEDSEEESDDDLLEYMSTTSHLSRIQSLDEDCSNILEDDDCSNILEDDDCSNILEDDDCSNILEDEDCSNILEDEDCSNILEDEDCSNILEDEDCSNILEDEDCSNILDNKELTHVLAKRDCIPVLEDKSTSTSEYGKCASALEEGKELHSNGENNGGGKESKANVSAPKQTTAVAPSVSAPKQTTAVAPSVSAAKQTSGVHLSVSAPKQTSGVHPSVSAPKQSSGVVSSVSALKQTSGVHLPVSASKQTSGVPPSVSAPKQTSGVPPSVSAPKQTSGVHPSVSAPKQTSGVHLSVCAPKQSCGVVSSVSAPKQTSGIPLSVSAPKQTSGIPLSVSAPKQTSGAVSSVSAPKQTSDVPPSVGAPKQTSKVPPSVSARKQTSGAVPSVSAAKQTSGVPLSMSAPKQTSKVPPSVSAPKQTSGVVPSVGAPKQTSGVPTSMSAPKQTSKVPPSVSAPKQTSEVPSSVSAPKQTSGVAPSVSAPKQTSGVAPSVSAPKQTSGVPPSVSAAKQTSGAPTSVSAPKQTSERPSSVSAAKQTSEVPPSVSAAKQTSEVPQSVSAAKQTSEVPPSMSAAKQTFEVSPSVSAPKLTSEVPPLVSAPTQTSGVSAAKQTSEVPPSVSAPKQTSGVSAAKQTSGVPPSVSAPKQTSGVPPSVSAPKQTSVVPPSVSAPKQTSGVSAAKQTSGVPPSVSAPKQTSGVSTDKQTSGVVPSVSSGKQTSGVVPSVSSGKQTSEVPQSVSAAKQTSEVPQSVRAAKQTSGVPPLVTAAKQTSGVPPSVSTAKQTSGVVPSVSSGKQTSEVPQSVSSGKQTSEVPQSVSSGKQTSGVVPSVSAAKQTSGVPPSVSAAKQTSGVPPSVSAAKQTSGVPLSVSAAKQTSEVPPSVSAAEQTSEVPLSISTAKQTSEVPPSVSAAEQTSEVPPSVSTAKQTSGVPTSVSAAKQTSEVPPSVSAAKQTSEVPPSVSAAKQTSEVGLSVDTTKQVLEVLPSVSADTHAFDALSPVPTTEDQTSHALSPVPGTEDQTSHALSPVPTTEDQTYHALSPVPATEDQTYHALSPVPATEDQTSHALSPVPATEDQTSHALSPVPVNEDQTSHALSPVPTTEDQTSHALSPVPATEDQTSHALSPVPTTEEHTSQALSPVSTTEDQTSRALSPVTDTEEHTSQALSPVPATEEQTSHALSPVPNTEEQTSHATSPVPATEDQTSHALSPLPATEEHALSPVPATKEHALSPVPTTEENTSQALSPVPTTKENTSHTLSPVPATEDQTSHALSPVPATEDQTSHALSPVPTTEEQTSQTLSPLPAIEDQISQELSPVPATEENTSHALSPVPTTEENTSHALSPVPTTEEQTSRALSPVPATEEQTSRALSPVPTTEDQTSRALSPVPTTEEHTLQVTEMFLPSSITEEQHPSYLLVKLSTPWTHSPESIQHPLETSQRKPASPELPVVTADRLAEVGPLLNNEKGDTNHSNPSVNPLSGVAVGTDHFVDSELDITSLTKQESKETETDLSNADIESELNSIVLETVRSRIRLNELHSKDDSEASDVQLDISGIDTTKQSACGSTLLNAKKRISVTELESETNEVYQTCTTFTVDQNESAKDFNGISPYLPSSSSLPETLQDNSHSSKTAESIETSLTDTFETTPSLEESMEHTIVSQIGISQSASSNAFCDVSIETGVTALPDDTSSCIQPSGTDTCDSGFVETPTHEAENARIQSHEADNTRLQMCEAEDKMIQKCEAENTMIQACEAENTMIQACEAENTMIQACEAENTVITPYEAEATTLPTYEAETTILPTYEAETTILPTYEAENTILPTYEAENTILPTYEAENTILPTYEAENTRIQTYKANNPMLENSLIPICETGTVRSLTNSTADSNLLPLATPVGSAHRNLTMVQQFLNAKLSQLSSSAEDVTPQSVCLEQYPNSISRNDEATTIKDIKSSFIEANFDDRISSSLREIFNEAWDNFGGADKWGVCGESLEDGGSSSASSDTCCDEDAGSSDLSDSLDEDEAVGVNSHKDVLPRLETMPKEIDRHQAKLRSSLSWLLSKVYGCNIPKELQDPFYETAEGQPVLRPIMVNMMSSSELYCQACSNMFPETHTQWQGHWSIIQVLSRKGIYISEVQESAVTETVLVQTAPFRLKAHLALIDALMKAYICEVASVEKVVKAVRQITTFPASSELPGTPDEALVFWVNKVCSVFGSEGGSKRRSDEILEGLAGHKVRVCSKALSHSAPVHVPFLEDLMRDIGDGCSLAAVISFYKPHLLNIQGLCLSQGIGVADSLHNLSQIGEFCRNHLPSKSFYLSYEDLLYTHDTMRVNILAFLADLFFYFENGPNLLKAEDHGLGSVKSSSEKIEGMIAAGKKSSQNVHSGIQISQATKRSFHKQGFEETANNLGMGRSGGGSPVSHQPLLSKRIAGRHCIPQEEAGTSVTSLGKRRTGRRAVSLFSAQDQDIVHKSVLAWQDDQEILNRSDNNRNNRSDKLLGKLSSDSMLNENFNANNSMSLNLSGLESPIQLDYLDFESVTSAQGRLSSPQQQPDHRRSKTPTSMSGDHWMEPLMPALLRPTKERETSLSKAEERGDRSPRRRKVTSPTEHHFLPTPPVQRSTAQSPQQRRQHHHADTEGNLSEQSDETTVSPLASGYLSERSQSPFVKQQGQGTRGRVFEAFVVGPDLEETEDPLEVQEKLSNSGNLSQPDSDRATDISTANSYTVKDRPCSAQAARAAGIPVVADSEDAIRSREGSIASSGEYSDHESQKIHQEYKVRESTLTPTPGSKVAADININNNSKSMLLISDHLSNNTSKCGDIDSSIISKLTTTNFAELKRLKDKLGYNLDKVDGNSLIYMQSGSHGGPYDKMSGVDMKSMFVIKQDQSQQQSKDGSDKTRSRNQQPETSAQVIPDNATLEAKEANPGSLEMQQLRLKLEQKRMDIERKKHRQEAQQNKIRQQLGKAAFMRVVSKHIDGEADGDDHVDTTRSDHHSSNSTQAQLQARLGHPLQTLPFGDSSRPQLPAHSAPLHYQGGQKHSAIPPDASAQRFTDWRAQSQLSRLGGGNISSLSAAESVPTNLDSAQQQQYLLLAAGAVGGSDARSDYSSLSPGNKAFSREGIQQTIDTVRNKWFKNDNGLMSHERGGSEDEDDDDGSFRLHDGDLLAGARPRSVQNHSRSPARSHSQSPLHGTPHMTHSHPDISVSNFMQDTTSLSQSVPEVEYQEYDSSLDKLNSSLTELQGEIMRLSLQHEQLKAAQSPVSNQASRFGPRSESLTSVGTPPVGVAPTQSRPIHGIPQKAPAARQSIPFSSSQHQLPTTNFLPPQNDIAAAGGYNMHAPMDPQEPALLDSAPNNTTPYDSEPTPDQLNMNSSEHEDVMNTSSDGYFVTFGDKGTPKRLKPKLPEHRTRGASPSPNAGHATSTSMMTLSSETPPGVSSEVAANLAGQTIVPTLNFDESSDQSSPHIGFIIKDEAVAVKESAVEDDMQKKRVKLIEMQRKRKEEQERKRSEKEAETAKKQEEKQLKEEELERKKAEEKARKEHIFQQYIQKKQEDEESPAKPPPSRKRDTSASKQRPKSMFVKSKAPEPGSLGPDSGSSSQEDLTSRPNAGGRTTPGVMTALRSSLHFRLPEPSKIRKAVSCNTLQGATNGAPGPATYRRPTSPDLNRIKQQRLKSNNHDSGSESGSNPGYEYAGPKLFVKPSARSNRHIIVNAISHCCLAGSVNTDMKNKVLEELAKCDANHFLILFRDAGCQYRGLFVFSPETEEAFKLLGVGPKHIANAMCEKFYKYNSGAKSFSEITSTKHLSVSIDAVVLHTAVWKSVKSVIKR